MSNNNENNQIIINVETQSEKKKRGGSQKTSWVWDWFKPDEMGVICQVEIFQGEVCNKRYKNGSSTGNLITHLNNKHQITEGLKKDEYIVSKLFYFNKFL
jgi:hypothetical protein